MPAMSGFVDFDPERDIPSLRNRVIFITGGTAGLGRASVEALAKHEPAHIYFTGRNAQSGESLIADVKKSNPAVGMTFVKMDMASLTSVKKACDQFLHARLDILMCNAGIMDEPLAVSEDGFEIHFAVNHLAHAMITKRLLPIMLKTAEIPDSDVRLISLTSVGWQMHPKNGIAFDTLRSKQGNLTMLGFSLRYGQSKLSNILYAAEIARRYPSIKAVSVHPGVVATDLVNNLPTMRKALVYGTNWLMGISVMDENKGRLSQLWVAAGASRNELVNGAYYMPVGVLSNDKLDKTAKSEELARELWLYTEDVLSKVT
ncbi:oxidoreductase [Annulohypoxylon maeteangense]|uniref:oxidoreductase n=1 Tax=Annulohypoxylon maeteangense TaxID=1927788 RepID=UPI0020080D51|nr:oxidoreductase [Annulohypoxylon maeteangense]KAI0884934.1 oxidoreductase [Annulohypoxylon maeteangense]